MAVAKKRTTKKKASVATSLTIARRRFKPGENGSIDIPVGSLINDEKVSLRVIVFRGKKPGPTLCVCAALHGDEINGVEIIRRLIRLRLLRRLRGSLVVVPVVNAPGFLSRSRYLPDRRDLNRLFPGSRTGSLGSRLAQAFASKVLSKCSHVIDLHTGAASRANLPQIRVTAGAREDLELAKVFGAPVIIESKTRPGSLRATLRKRHKPVLVFEGGEALRLDRQAIRFGLRGVLAVMRQLEMLPKDSDANSLIRNRKVIVSSTSYWERAPRGGLLEPKVQLGAVVAEGAILGTVSDPFGNQTTNIESVAGGIVIGKTNHALVDEGDAVFHIAATDNLARADRFIRQNRENLDREKSAD